MRRLGALVIAGLAVLAPATAADAQVPMSRFFSDLIASAARVDARMGQICLDPSGNVVSGACAPPNATVPIGQNNLTDFIVAAQQGTTPAMLNQGIGLQMSMFPFDPGLDMSSPGIDGVPALFGFAPSFTMHAGSIGRHKMSVAFNYQNTTFGSLDGIGLDSGQMGFVFHAPSSLQPQFGNDVLQESLAYRLQRDTGTFSLVYGVTDRFDIGVAVPIVHLQAEGQVTAQIFRAPGSDPATHYFDVYPATPESAPGCATSSIDVPTLVRFGQPLPDTTSQNVPFDMVQLDSRTVYRRCSANGLGDVIVHGRYRFAALGVQGFGASVDVRLPTGNKDELLGTGATRTTAAIVWSARVGRRFAPHASVGYTFSFGNSSALFNDVPGSGLAPSPLDLKVPDELDFAVGTDVLVLRRLTAAIDVFGRRIPDMQRFDLAPASSVLLPGDPQVPGTVLVAAGTGINTLVGLGTGQVAISERVLLKGQVLFPIWGDGLAPRVSVGMGLGYRF